MSQHHIQVVLDGDQTYQENGRALVHRYQQKKITLTMYQQIQDWLVRQALWRHQRQEQRRGT